MKVLEICPYEPPASGWTMRLKLLRRLIRERGGVCEVLDIGPSRRLVRPECIPVMDARDYLAKLTSFARRGFTFHCHINGEYFRGLLLALAALIICWLFRNPRLVTFHAGTTQPFLEGWRKYALYPLFRIIFGLADAVICNSETVRSRLAPFAHPSKTFPIPAFSKQYLDYKKVQLDAGLERFIESRAPMVSTYLCFRDGFFVDVLADALPYLVERWPNLGLVIVGTGDGRADFESAMEARRLAGHVFLAGDLPHDHFMTLLSKSAVHIRTHIRDGVSATVLEALSLRIPVVASENGIRPQSVIAYRADDPSHLAERAHWTLGHRAQVVEAIAAPDVADTAAMEVDLISGARCSKLAPQPDVR